MTDWKAANLALREARDALDERKRREAERTAAEAREQRRSLMQAGRL